jgi:ferredoxin-type protein NapG
VCPVHAIIKAPPAGGLAAGTPIIDPAIQACVVCADMPCAHACPTGALVPPSDGWANVHMGILELDPERCITRVEGCVGCGVCVTACVTSPSSLRLRVAGAA